MNVLEGILFGLVEGLTEFIPVSSTGHLILTKDVLGLHQKGVESYLIVIQSGALLAAMVYYRDKVWSLCRALTFRKREDTHFLGKILLAFFPAALVGLLLDKKIEAFLFSPW